MQVHSVAAVVATPRSGDDPAAVGKRLAAMYRATLETPVDGASSFTVRLSGAGAAMLRCVPMPRSWFISEAVHLAARTAEPRVTRSGQTVV